ncbi:MAG: tetratricopeptide repeat protein [Deltaproteobacteria bacterium]|nr:tetratricopeptide repeat protein [Deltaproteobacteria bacterium]
MKEETVEEGRAYEALQAGEPEEALTLAERLLARNSRSARAHHVRGLALAELERVPAALAALEKACKLGGAPWEAHLDLVEVLLYGAGEPEAALATCRAALAAKPAERTLKTGLLHLQGEALLELGLAAQALEAYESARRLGPDSDDTEGRAAALFELCRFKEAIGALRLALRHRPGVGADGIFTLAVALERTGEADAAHRHFLTAARKDPEHHAVPRHMPPEDFEALVAEAVEELPEKVSTALQEVQVVVEAWPDPEDLCLTDPPLSPMIFGMFRGHSLRDRSHGDPWSLLPPQIVVYQRNLELQCTSREEMVEEIRITVWHEVGHFLGLDEEDLDDRGLS